MFFLKNILYNSRMLLSLMFSLHLPFPTLLAPTATTLSSQQKRLVDEFLPEEVAFSSLWVTCNAVGHTAAFFCYDRFFFTVILSLSHVILSIPGNKSS